MKMKLFNISISYIIIIALLNEYGGLLSNPFNISIDRRCKSRNLRVNSLKREFGERYDKQYLKETMAH